MRANWWGKKLILAIRGKNAFPDRKNIVHAFTCGGVDYYQYKSFEEIAYRRALAANTIYTEISNGVDNFFMDKWIEKVDSLVNGDSFKMKEMRQLEELVYILKERRKFIMPADQHYKLAAVVYFDATENPASFDWAYARKKIEHWKAHEGAHDFFTRAPLRELMPFLGAHAKNLQHFFTVAQELDKIRLTSVLGDSSNETKKILENYADRFFLTEMSSEKINAN